MMAEDISDFTEFPYEAKCQVCGMIVTVPKSEEFDFGQAPCEHGYSHYNCTGCGACIDYGTHAVLRCRDCGAYTLHVDEESTSCKACGRHSHAPSPEEPAAYDSYWSSNPYI